MGAVKGYIFILNTSNQLSCVFSVFLFFYFENRKGVPPASPRRASPCACVCYIGESGRGKGGKCARLRRGSEDSECTSRQPGSSSPSSSSSAAAAAAALRLPDPDLRCLQRPVLRASAVEAPVSTANRHLPPHTFPLSPPERGYS